MRDIHLGKLLWGLTVLLAAPLALSPFCGSLHWTARAAMTPQQAVKISIADFAFKPGDITIAAGQTITWTNNDGAPHGLEYEDGAQGTDLLLPGANFSRRFAQPGSYDYVCPIHPYMSGHVLVRAK
jgi:plastocyanin